MSKESILKAFGIGIAIIPGVFIVAQNLTEYWKIILFAILPLIIGCVFEAQKIIGNRKTTLEYLFLGFLLSYSAFVPGRHEHDYVFKSHLALWPVMFIFFFGMIITFKDRAKKLRAHLNEGTVFLQAIAMFCWTAGSVPTNPAFLMLTLLFLPLLIAATFHAFSKKEHHPRTKLAFGIMTTLGLLMLTANNVYAIYKMTEPSLNGRLDQLALLIFSYFVLGTSAIYIVRHIMLILPYLPSRRQSIKKYISQAKETNQEHIARLSPQQLNPRAAWIIILVAVFIIASNQFLQIFQVATVTWLIIFAGEKILAFYHTQPN